MLLMHLHVHAGYYDNQKFLIADLPSLYCSQFHTASGFSINNEMEKRTTKAMTERIQL